MFQAISAGMGETDNSAFFIIQQGPFLLRWYICEKDELVQRVCAGYCAFYKPGECPRISSVRVFCGTESDHEGRDLASNGRMPS